MGLKSLLKRNEEILDEREKRKAVVRKRSIYFGTDSATNGANPDHLIPIGKQKGYDRNSKVIPVKSILSQRMMIRRNSIDGDSDIEEDIFETSDGENDSDKSDEIQSASKITTQNTDIQASARRGSELGLESDYDQLKLELNRSLPDDGFKKDRLNQPPKNHRKSISRDTLFASGM